MKSRFVSCMVLWLALAGSGVARAGDADAGQALFNEGRAALDKGDLPTAHAKFMESLKLSRRPNTLFNLAQCEEKEGHPASALQHWHEGFGMVDANDERRPLAAERIVDLERRVPKVAIQLDAALPEGAVIRLDGQELARTALSTPLPLDPGEHTLTVVAQGHSDRNEKFVLKEGEQKSMRLEAGPPTDVKSTEPTNTTPQAEPSSGSSGTGRKVGFVVGGVGAASLVVGLVTGGLTLGKKSTADANCKTNGCNPTGTAAESSGKTLSTVSTITFVGGLALMGTGVVLILTGKPASPAPPQAQP